MAASGALRGMADIRFCAAAVRRLKNSKLNSLGRRLTSKLPDIPNSGLGTINTTWNYPQRQCNKRPGWCH